MARLALRCFHPLCNKLQPLEKEGRDAVHLRTAAVLKMPPSYFLLLSFISALQLTTQVVSLLCAQ